MLSLKAIKLDVLTNGSGNGSASYTTSITGWLYAVQWIDGTFDDGVDGTISCELPNTPGVSRTVVTLPNANDDKMYYPRTLEHLDTDITVLTTHCCPVLDGIVKLTVAQGGNAKTGGCVIYYL